MYHYMTFYGYISMLIVTHVWFDFIFIVSRSWRNHIILLLMFVAEKVLLLLVISVTEKKTRIYWTPLNNRDLL